MRVRNVTAEHLLMPWGKTLAPGEIELLPRWLSEHKGIQIDLNLGNLKDVSPDVSDAADAKRFRWLMSGNAFQFQDEIEFCNDADDLERLRIEIDTAMARE